MDCSTHRIGAGIPCPLCSDRREKEPISGPDKRDYLHCLSCQLIFVQPHHLPSVDQERARYQQHQNSFIDSGYRDFLTTAIEPLLPHLHPTMRGLDYGCGPTPVLASLIEQQGLECEVYDPFFYRKALTHPYDFILSTECFEHFHHPRQEIERICTLLSPSAWLGIMTELWQTPQAFATWPYARDTTHVVFYHFKTLHFLTTLFPLRLHFCDQQRVALFQKL